MKYVRYHNIVMPAAVKNSFALLAENMYMSLGVTMEPVDGFKTKTDVLNELRSRVKNPDLARLKDISYIESLDPQEFEPPLVGNIPAMRDPSQQQQVWPVPNKPIVDPRMTGRIVKFGPKNIINPTTLYYLVHNAGMYGFVFYGPKDPSIWYWRGDLLPNRYTPEQTVSMFSNELAYLL